MATQARWGAGIRVPWHKGLLGVALLAGTLAVARQGNESSAALANFQQGYNAFLAKDYAAAAGFLRPAAATPTAISDYAEFYLASALQNNGDLAGAIPILSGFEAKHPGTLLGPRANLALATSLAVEDPAGALALLKSRQESLPHPASDLQMARAYESAGRAKEATSVLADIYYRYPQSQEAAEASRRKGEFPKATVEQLRRRADALWTASQSASRAERTRLAIAAQAAYRETATAARGAAKEQAQVRAASANLAAGRTGLALEALTPLKPADPEATAERYYVMGECYRKLKRESAFLARVKALGELYPSSPWNEEARFSAGNYTLLKRGATDAAPYYASLCERFPQGKYAAQIHWKLTWIRYREGNKEAARRLMEEHVAKYTGFHVPAALYWLGRIAESSDSARSQAYFRQAAETSPQGFYGGIAARRITNPGAAPKRAPQPFPRPADAAMRASKVAAFRSIDLLELAASELQQAAKPDTPFRPYWLVELAAVERDRGRFHVALEDARRAVPLYTSLQIDQLPRNVWELLFPLPWWDEVKADAAREGVDPYLVAGLIRQESAFYDRAVSRASARGLMQVLPSMGRFLAKRLGVHPYSTETLFDARTNLKLGIHYFRTLIEEHQGRVEDTLAAYNAGPNRVQAWRAIGFEDTVEFVESIPFSETREYIQVVLRNAELYRKLYP